MFVQKRMGEMRSLLLIFLLLISSKIFSQACCTAGTPLLSSLETSTAQKGVLNFGLGYRYNSLQDIYAGTVKLDDNSLERISQSVIFQIDYGIFDRVTLTGLFSYITQQRFNTPVNGIANSLSSSGIGDALLLVKYNIIQQNILDETDLSVGTGIKAPLGKSDVTNNGLLIPADMQPGTGSWDFIIWTYFSQGRLLELPLNIVANFSYRFNGTNERFGVNNGGYKFGNEMIAQLGFGYRTDSPFDFTLFTRFRHTNPDQFSAGEIPNTGGDWLYLVPGLNIKIYDTLTLRLTGEIPIYTDVLGTQLTTTFTSAATFYYSIGGNY